MLALFYNLLRRLWKSFCSKISSSVLIFFLPTIFILLQNRLPYQPFLYFYTRHQPFSREYVALRLLYRWSPAFFSVFKASLVWVKCATRKWNRVRLFGFVLSSLNGRYNNKQLLNCRYCKTVSNYENRQSSKKIRGGMLDEEKSNWVTCQRQTSFHTAAMVEKFNNFKHLAERQVEVFLYF